jgi:hypothetical protein
VIESAEAIDRFARWINRRKKWRTKAQRRHATDFGNIGFTIVFVLLSIAHCAACKGRSKRQSFLSLQVLFLMCWKEIGVRTRWIYGRYDYSDMLGPELGNAIATSIDENLPRKETAISTHGPHSRLSGVATVSFVTSRNIFVKVLTRPGRRSETRTEKLASVTTITAFWLRRVGARCRPRRYLSAKNSLRLDRTRFLHSDKANRQYCRNGKIVISCH